MRRIYILLSIILTVLISCDSSVQQEYRFKYIKSKVSGIAFENTIVTNDSLNILNYQYIYNGAGVGIGDFNKDGFSDIFFSANQNTSELYLNKGKLKFVNITSQSGVSTSSWVNGVSIIDINQDGWDDIYLSVGGNKCPSTDCNNLLFINQGTNDTGIPTFIEMADKYGLDHPDYSQQTTFFDYDKDGDLDAFTVRNGSTSFSRNTPYPKQYFPKYLTDILYENVQSDSLDHPHFIDVSAQKGINEKGFSLGVSIEDLNRDGLPDIYVSNDFITNDILYINQGAESDYAFAKAEKEILPVTSYNSMGVDIADLNNDLLPDITVVDMLPSNYERQKKMLGSNNYDKYVLALKNDYTSQYVRNTLQLHNGVLKDQLLPFSEIAHLAGISSTDWSWAPLCADFDNDGNKDIYITNGYVKDITDLDFINYSGTSNTFGTAAAKQKKLKGFVDQLQGIHIPNYFFQNTGNAIFKDVSNSWSSQENSFSNGAAYADFDKDGDLDIVVNNINAPASLIENKGESTSSHYLRINLIGSELNKKAIGSTVFIWSDQKKQAQSLRPIKGYLSSVEPTLHFGIQTTVVDSLQVRWPDGTINTYFNLPSNQEITLQKNKKDALFLKNNPPNFLFQETKQLRHRTLENPYNDFVKQPLIPKQYHMLSGAIATGNIDNYEGDEIFIGGNRNSPSILYTEKEGAFTPIASFSQLSDVTTSDMLDINQDGHVDIYVGLGGTDASSFQDFIILNNGDGSYTKTTAILPEISANTTSISTFDFDLDGDADIFITGGVLPGKYPLGTKSLLLENKGSTFKVKQEILHNQIVTSSSLNTDHTVLYTVGHWQEVKKFQITKEGLKADDITFIDHTGTAVEFSGWWNVIEAIDMDNDGDDDLILGNQGINGFIKPSYGKPLYVYKEDYDKNGSIDPILAQHFKESKNNNSTLKPIHTRDDVMKQIVSLKKRYRTYDAFAKEDFKTLLNIKSLEKESLQATTFKSYYAQNIDNSTYRIKELPLACQITTINDMVIEDFNEDGFKDVLMMQNDISSEANYGISSAGTGLLIEGSDKGFVLDNKLENTIQILGQSNHIAHFKNSKGETYVIATRVNDSTKLFKIKNSISLKSR